MDHRRFVTFLVFFFAFTYLYNAIIVPKLFPRPEQPVAANNEPGQGAVNAQAGDNASDEGSNTDDAKDPTGAEKNEDLPPAIHPNRKSTLGSLDLGSGYFLQVDVNSKGAVIEAVRLSDRKFKELKDQQQQVNVLGTNTTQDRTFSTGVSAIDAQLQKHNMSLETVNWELVSEDPGHVQFAYTAPDRTLRVEKSYRLTKVDVPPEEIGEQLITNAAGFTIEVELRVRNLSTTPTIVEYEIQGPVGVILENAEHTRKYRDIKIEFIGEDDDDVTLGGKAVSGLYSTHVGANEQQTRNNLKQKEAWTGAFRYAGVDVQFFAALIAPLDTRDQAQQLADKWIARTYPVMVQEDRLDAYRSDISFRMASSPRQLGPADGADDSFTHRYALFVGPKRRELLDPPPLEAEEVLDYGSWFGFIARGMHRLLDTFYGLGMPYVFAIICLTILVRGCMFPLSRKQAISAAKMKDLQPKINELKLKYGDDKEKFAKAQMELWRKHNINPLSGCLPVFVQLPVFIALYTALNTAVDLRLARFLWIDNLAAPDALFRMPKIPFLGSDFNILPCITVVLFLIQQKLFMPPPTDEQTAMQQKMMNFMTIFMGVMFWHVPAGLCIYFIASSIWGIAERKLLGNTSAASTEIIAAPQTASESGAATKTKSGPDEKTELGFFGRIVAAAEEAQKQAEKTKAKQNKGKKGKKRG